MPDDFFNEHQNPSVRDSGMVLAESEGFRGNRDHLEAFVRLIATPIRHSGRSEALHQWKAYNKVPTLDTNGKPVKAAPRFREIDLRGADLRNIYIGYIDLRGARLDDADLRGVRMKGAWLDGASLEGAKLDGAYFAFASFARANLAHSTARETNFREAKLIGADFTDSDLTGALLADTQRRDWNLRDIRCDYVYWSVSKPRTTYAPKEFESLFSEEAMVTLESSGMIDQQELSSLPMLVHALKTHHGAVVRLHNVQDSNGRFLIRLKIEDNAGQTVEALESVLKKYMSEMKQNVTINTIINNEIATVGHLIQAGNIQTGGNGQQGNAIMAKFVNKIGGDVGNLIQGDTVNVHIEPQTAKALEDIVAKTPAEKPGFTEELKSEVIGALKSIALEQAKALPKNVYSLLKEFFPSYVRPFLP
jgi:hypothetical protein